ncbi:MAG: hypothetical protein IIB08_01950 [Bacteroidetes bacterium]|nr:hypothetical protein [Bacteroidota bacterium]
MAEKTKVTEISEFISKDFMVGNSNSLIPVGDFINLNEFRLYLSQKLSNLMDNNYDSFINILYRIDVDEEKLSKLFSGTNRENISADLADLIIERSIQKAEFRQKYKNGKL